MSPAADKTSFLRQRQRRESYEPGRDVKWQRYERAKQSWTEANPDATPAEYTAAMRRISQECGV